VNGGGEGMPSSRGHLSRRSPLLGFRENINSDPKQFYGLILNGHYDELLDSGQAWSKVFHGHSYRGFKRKLSGTFQVRKNQAFGISDA
jgi:hypothetical protein